MYGNEELQNMYARQVKGVCDRAVTYQTALLQLEKDTFYHRDSISRDKA